MSINRVELTGNLTRDPELRATAGGTSVLAFGLAVNDRKKNPRTGEWEDVPNYVDCAVFGNRADSLSRILCKGMKVAVAGKLHYEQWEKDGQKRSRLSVTADEVELMQRRVEKVPDARGGGRFPTYSGVVEPVYDDEIPF